MAMDVKKTSLTTGILFAIFHAVGLPAIQFGLIDSAQKMHFLSFPYSVLPFMLSTYLISVLGAFVAGLVTGWLYSTIYNKLK